MKSLEGEINNGFVGSVTDLSDEEDYHQEPTVSVTSPELH